MIKIYHESNNGDRVVITDAKDLRQFEDEATEALVKLYEADGNDIEFSLGLVLPRLFRIAFKLAGYKSDEVRESRLLIAGYESPHEENLIVSVESPVRGAGAVAAAFVATEKEKGAQ